MKIDKININAYGKLEDKKIELKDGINLIRGENESGKSTLLNYIISSFFGLSKLKESKEISDYEKYKPWSGKEYSGSISYKLDNGEHFEVFRKFDNKNAIIYNSNKEDISDAFEINKKDGNKFFTNQTGLSKEMYVSSIISTQGEVRLDQDSQNSIVQKITNIAGTGEDNVSFSKAQKRLKDKITEEIGTTRTKDKPLNKLMDEEYSLNEKISEIRPYEDKKYTIDEYIEEADRKIKTNEEKNNLLKEIEGIIKEDSYIYKEKEEDSIKLRDSNKDKEEFVSRAAAIENERKEKEEEVSQIERKISKIELKEESKHKSAFGIGLIIFAVLIIAAIICCFTVNISVVKIISIVVGAISLLASVLIGCALIKNKKIEKENVLKEKEINNLNSRINQIRLNMNETNSNKAKLEGQIEFLDKQINELKGKLLTYDGKIVENKANKQAIIEKYKPEVDNNYLEKVVGLKNIEEEINNAKEELLDSKSQKNRLELEVEQINKEIEEKVIIEEKLKALEEEKEILKQKEKEITIANEYLNEAYEEMKKRITPKFTENLSKNISKISNNKYNKVLINDKKGLVIQRDNGEYIDLNKLSVGTIDELYLSLRLTMVDDISKENMPIMLDETFAYFDDKRLENTLKYLNSEVKDHQILLFTCTNREKEILDKLKIKYNEVVL